MPSLPADADRFQVSVVCPVCGCTGTATEAALTRSPMKRRKCRGLSISIIGSKVTPYCQHWFEAA